MRPYTSETLSLSAGHVCLSTDNRKSKHVFDVQSETVNQCLQASCRALLATHSHLHHDTAAIRLNLGALAGSQPSPTSSWSNDQATLEKLMPWIITSPPRPTSSLPAQTPGSKQTDASPFISLSLSQPAKTAQEPTVLQLSVAPIDIIYSQLCLLSLLDFLNAAWPATNLDPLKMRASVSLQEIVQETLQKQQHIVRRQQQRNMQRTKVVITPCSKEDYCLFSMTMPTILGQSVAYFVD